MDGNTSAKHKRKIGPTSHAPVDCDKIRRDAFGPLLGKIVEGKKSLTLAEQRSALRASHGIVFLTPCGFNWQ